MSVVEVARKQLQRILDENSVHVRKLFQPRLAVEGWIKLVRQALGMSGAQLARKMGVSRALVSNTEKAETEGRVTIKKMHEFAEAMECEFVYCMIPKDKIETILAQRAAEKAKLIVDRTNRHMSLEAQGLSNEQANSEVERLASEILKGKISNLWND